MLPRCFATLACLLIFEAQFEFVKDKKGRVTGMLLRHGSEETFARRMGSTPAR